MGYPTHELIPAAILYEHPKGLTRDEIIDKLAGIPVSGYTKFKPEDPLNSVDSGNIGRYNRGLKGFAATFNLDLSQEFRDFHQSTMDKNGLPICPIRVRRVQNFRGWDNPAKWLNEVETHIENDIGPPSVVKRTSEEPVEVGKIIGVDIYHHPHFFHEGKVLNVLSQRSTRFKYIGEWVKGFHQKLEVLPFVQLVEREDLTDEQLESKYPVYQTDKKYDFNQGQGSFQITRSRERFWWRFDDGKYSLDPITFYAAPMVSSSIMRDGYAISDLILTCEVIKQQAWKIFSRRGYDHLSQFFTAYPDSKRRYDEFIEFAFRPKVERPDESAADFMRRRLLWSTEARDLPQSQ